MTAQAIDLVLQRIFCDVVILRLPLCPVFPMITTAPSCHDQNALPVGEIEEFLTLEFAFQANRVQAHVAHVTELVLQSLGVLA